MTDEQDSDAALWLAASSGTERAFVTIFDRYRTRERSELAAWRREWGCTCAPETLPSAADGSVTDADSTVLGRA